MRRVVALSVMALAVLAFGFMLNSIFFRDERGPSCVPLDYTCNYKRYMNDISRKPPDFSFASAVAITTPEAIRRNLDAVIALEDYESASMLRVLHAYPDGVQRKICNSRSLMLKLRARGRDVRSPYQRQEYERLLSELRCT